MAKTSEDHKNGVRDGKKQLTDRLLDVLSELHGTDSDSALADRIGVSPASLSQWRSGTAAPHRTALKTICEDLASLYVEPLAEIQPVSPRLDSKTWHIHWNKKARQQLKQRLSNRHGVYLFYDSRGHVTYVGQAKGDLFGEIEKRLKQALRHGTYARESSEAALKVRHLLQGDVTRFVSAYATVTGRAAHNLEAILIRAAFNNVQNRKSGKICLGTQKL
jgi:transcriptional regulator with XRE-family HTH domain